MADGSLPRLVTERIPVTDRASWLAMRKKDITASSVAAMFGAHRHMTALALWAEKSGVELRDDDNAFARRGRHIEFSILSAARELPEFEGLSLEQAGFYVRAPALRIGATPDFLLTYPDGSVEPVDAKSVAPWVYATDWNDGPPLDVLLQTLTQSMMLDARRGWVAAGVMSPDFPVELYRVERNPIAEQRIINQTREFWASVEAGEMPAPVARDQHTLQALFPRAEKKDPLDWSEEETMLALANEHAALAEQIKPMAGRISEIEALLKAKLGPNESAAAAGLSVTWKEQKRKAYSVPETSFRVLRIKHYTPDGDELG